MSSINLYILHHHSILILLTFPDISHTNTSYYMINDQYMYVIILSTNISFNS